MRIFSKTAILFFLIAISGITFASKDPARGKNGMVVSESKLATKVGVEILKNGGNAVDAAVAVGFALAVTHPSAGNIGGGGFMVLHLSNGRNTTIDFRETAPGAAFEKMFQDENGNVLTESSLEGGNSVGIPGSVDGLIYALENYGTKSLAEVIQPAIALAASGFKVEWRLAEFINYYNDRFNQFAASRKIFTDNGKTIYDGYLLVQQDLANTLELIKKYGRDGFYKGETAEKFIATVKKHYGVISLQDLADYRCVEREPIKGNYNEYEIISMPPPSSGGIVLIQALKTLEKFNFSEKDWGSSEYIHTLVEILKRLYSDRSQHIADPDFHSVPVNDLLSEQYILNLYKNIKYSATPSKYIEPEIFEIKESDQTTHYCVADKFGNAVSVTTTLNSPFGNKIVVEDAGFLLNNEMDDFSAKPGTPNQFGLIGNTANSVQPHKRMLSSMTPTIIFKNGNPVILLGGRGGSKIITAVLQVAVNVINFNMNIREAIDAPRVHHQWLPDSLYYEKFSLSKDVIKNLKRRGHTIGSRKTLGNVEGIYIDNSSQLYWGSNDPRGFGLAEGF